MEIKEMYALAGAVYRDNFKGSCVDRDDMLQEGVIGILRAEKNYDESKGSFRTLAYLYALWGMMDYYNKEKAERINNVSLSDYENILKCEIDLRESCGLDKICRGVFKDGKKKDIVDLYLSNKSYEEIGKNVGVSKQRVGKVLGELKDKIKSNYIYVDENIMER